MPPTHRTNVLRRLGLPLKSSPSIEELSEMTGIALDDLKTVCARGGGQGQAIPKQYLAGLSTSQKKKQAQLITAAKERYAETGEVEDRPKVSDAPTKRSPHVIRFERKYGFPVTDKKQLKKTFPDTDIYTILSKGAAAYGSSGSRPNVGISQWTNARLASVLTGGPSLRVDMDLVGPKSLQTIKGVTLSGKGMSRVYSFLDKATDCDIAAKYGG